MRSRRADHVHHDVGEQWFEVGPGSFATCPLTQGALVRTWLRAGSTVVDAVAVLASVTGSGRHDLWSDDRACTEIDLRGVIGHRQVTDAYLAGLTRARGGRLVTFDRALTALHSDVAVLLAG